jgi:steroid 5-alpha reductase family enzyme
VVARASCRSRLRGSPGCPVSTCSWVELLTIVGPLLMTFLLTRGSGQALTERRMADRPQYADYIARTSGFIPRPPKRHRAAGA